MKKNIFVALDFSSFDKALNVANSVKNDASGLKITNELFAICGKEGVSKLANIGLEIFLDLYHQAVLLLVFHKVFVPFTQFNNYETYLVNKFIKITLELNYGNFKIR